MFPYFRLGPFLVQLPGLALLAGVWFGLSLAEKEAARLEAHTRPGGSSIQPTVLYNLIFYGLIAGLIGARLAYAIRFSSAYLANPLSLFALTPSTLSPGAGLVLGLAVAGLYGRRKGLALRPTLDALAPGLAVFMVALGVSHFLSGDAFGAPAYGPNSVALPWAIFLWDEYRHPSQIYETLAALAVLRQVALKRPLGQPGNGLNFLLVVALAATARVFLEAFRGDSVIWFGGFRAAQVVALFVLGASLWGIKRWAQSATTPAPVEP